MDNEWNVSIEAKSEKVLTEDIAEFTNIVYVDFFHERRTINTLWNCEVL